MYEFGVALVDIRSEVTSLASEVMLIQLVKLEFALEDLLTLYSTSRDLRKRW